MLSTNNILFNGNNSTGLKNPYKLLNSLAEIKKVSKTDLHQFLQLDHTSFTTFNIRSKDIPSTNRISITVSKNSARSFYLDKPLNNSTKTEVDLKDDCLTDAQNCDYLAFFNSNEHKAYTTFSDKIEANFEGTKANQPLLFLTLTFNTKHDNYYAFTTNWTAEDNCWEPIAKKNDYLRAWAQKFDENAEPFKVHIKKITVDNYPIANAYLQKFLRSIRLKWKPQNWKWCVIAELQKNGIWHFHLLSTPIVPYIHKCTLSKSFTSCWNCRAYLSKLWPWGRVELRSPGKKTISKYLAKYLFKSFHLRNLYQEHGLTKGHKSYRFFLNIYAYEERVVFIENQRKIDQLNQQILAPNQHLFKRNDGSLYYKTNEKLINRVVKPKIIKKNYRLSTRTLQTHSLLNLTNYAKNQEALIFKRCKRPRVTKDFQEFVITRLLLLCKKAEFIHLPLEERLIPKVDDKCNGLIYTHFQTKPILRFTFLPQQAQTVRDFIANLDTYAQEYDIEESKDFYYYYKPNISKEKSRNAFLDRWYSDYCYDYFKQPLYLRKGRTIM